MPKKERYATLAGAILLTIALPIAIDQGYFRYNPYPLPILGLIAIFLYLGFIITSSICKRIIKSFYLKNPKLSIVSFLGVSIIIIGILGIGEWWAIQKSISHVNKLRTENNPKPEQPKQIGKQPKTATSKERQNPTIQIIVIVNVPFIKGMPEQVKQQNQTGKAAITKTTTFTIDGIIVDRSPEFNQPKIPPNENISIAENVLTSDRIDLPYALQASFQNKKTTDMSQIGIKCDGAIGDFNFFVAGQPENMATVKKGIEDNIAIVSFSTPLKPESNMVVTLFSKTKIDITEMYYE